MRRVFKIKWMAAGLLWLCAQICTASSSNVSGAAALSSTASSQGAYHHYSTEAYDNDYAMDFRRCPQHFLHNEPIQYGAMTHFQLCYSGFALLFSPESKTAVFVAEHLTQARIESARKLPRTDSFRAEPRLPDTVKAKLSDYKDSPYDRGHLAPNGDMADVQSQFDSFSLANIIPQNREHNRNVWADIENHVRNLTMDYQESYVVTGTVFEGKTVDKAGDVLVPTHLYKAVYLPSENVSAVYFSPNSSHLSYEIIDVPTLTQRTGVVPFATVGQFAPELFELSDEQALQRVDWASYLKKIAMMIYRFWQGLN